MRLLIYPLVGIILFFLVHCSPSVSSTDQLKVFRYNQASGISSLDPAFAKDQSGIWPCFQLYNTLLQLDSQLVVKPMIAQRFEVSPDGLQYTFYLRQDVYFHNDSCFPSGKGRKLVAQDVVYSFSRLIDSQTASPGSWIFNDRVSSSNPFVALSDSVFVLNLKKPFYPITGILTMQYTSIIPHEAVTYYGSSFRAHPVGTGPFRFKKWLEGNALILVRNEHYFESSVQQKIPALDGVKVTFIDNKKTEFLSFKKGELDFVSGVDATYIDETLNEDGSLKQEWSDKMTISKTPFLNTEYLGFCLMPDRVKAPFNNKNFRLAVSYAIDRKEIIQYLRNGVGKPAEHGFAPMGLPSFNPNFNGASFDLSKAREFLATAGYPEGKGLSELTLYTNESYKDMALLIARQLEKVGIRLKVEIQQPALLREWMSKGDIAFFRGSWIADYPDAENFYTVFYSRNAAPPNYTRFHLPEFDNLYNECLSATDFALRQSIFEKMETILRDESPVIPLYYDEVLRFTSPRIKGLYPNGINLLDLRYVSVEE